MKALRQLDKTYKSIFKGSQPYIYHFRITKPLDSHNVPYCIDTLRTIREAKAPRIFALSVNVQSGSPVLTKTLREAMIQTAYDMKAPLYTFAEDCALESGFYLLSAGHKIYANPYALLGDVSSVSRDVKIDKLVRKYINVTLVKSGKHKNMGLALEETTPETAELKNKLAKVHHEDMIKGILESRDMVFERKGLRSEQVRKEILDGRTFNATEALERGLVDDIMTFEEFKDKYYKDYKLIEHTIDKDEHLGYEQLGQSLSNWTQILSTNHERPENVLESYNSEEMRNKVELAEDMLCLLRSERFMGKLKEFISSEMVGEVYESLQGRMSMSDIMEFLDQSEAGGKTLLGGRF